MILTRELFDEQRYEFANRITGAVPRVQKFQNLADTLVPKWFEWHPWTMKIVGACATYRWIGLPGCSNSGKTHCATGFACNWWVASPFDSSVIFCTTTMKMLKKRAWPIVQTFHDAITESQGEAFGNLVNSQTIWQARQGEDKHAIFGIAVQDGDANKVAANIQGIHTRRQMVVVDEAEAMPEAIWKACSNLYSYPIDAGGEFVFVCIGNPRSRLSRFGRFIEPENGWGSVTVDTDEWESKPQLDGKRAMVVRFDFRKSPNITEGRTVSRHLPSQQRVQSKLAVLRARGGENDPDHYAFDLGFPPPEGLTKTVFTETMLDKHKTYEQHQFSGSEWKIIGAFDYAGGGVGGNRPAVRFAAVGEVEFGKMGIEVMPAILLYLDATSKDPPMYQFARQLKDLCENVMFRGQKYQCAPENFGIDCTGTGTGMGDVAQREWSPKVIRILFSGATSEDPCSYEDQRPAKDVYKNKRAEMYFRGRNATMASQVRGLDKDTAAELCALEYKDDGARIVIEPKEDYVKRFQKSPDLADCFVMLFEVARIRGFQIVPIGFTVAAIEEADKVLDLAQRVYTDADMSQTEEVWEEHAF